MRRIAVVGPASPLSVNAQLDSQESDIFVVGWRPIERDQRRRAPSTNMSARTRAA
jgi:hypothetical protein